MRILKIKGYVTEGGEIDFGPPGSISWSQLSEFAVPEIPPGNGPDLNVSVDDEVFLSGKAGIVWATYELVQAEIITNALKALRIKTEIKGMHISNRQVFLIRPILNAHYHEMSFRAKSLLGMSVIRQALNREDQENA